MRRLCLISDSTGETLNSLVKAVLAQFEGEEFDIEIFPEVRLESQIKFILDKNPHKFDLLLCTFANQKLVQIAGDCAVQNNVVFIDVLSPIIQQFSLIFGIASKGAPGLQHQLSEEYFNRIAAINFTQQHDDGVGISTIHHADVILLGVSRTSKSPTATYLANRGIKCANIPYVHKNSIPESLFIMTKPLIVGLTKNPEELADIRKNRLQFLNQNTSTDYTDIEKIAEELQEFKKICRSQGWIILDVSKRSIEETAAVIMRKLKDHQELNAGN